MKKHILPLAALTAGLVLGFTAPRALAGESAKSAQGVQGVQAVQVIELFTSQGCSSCPSSNRLLTDYADDEGVLALTYSVEYWDYLGWKDTFADKSFSDRQRAYAAAIGHGRVYTPQMVVNGTWDKPRVFKAELAVDKLGGDAPVITLSEDGRILVTGPSPTPAELVLVSFTPGTQSVDVKRGENGGKTLEMTNVVTGVDVVGTYVASSASFKPALKKGAHYAVLLQGKGHGKVISAAHIAP